MALTGRKLGGWLNLVLSALLALGAWVLATVLFTRPELKALWDFSPQGRFTVEPATAELLAELRQEEREVELHTVFVPISTMQANTPEQRHLRGLRLRLQQLTRDLLRQYDYLGGDAVTVTHHDLLREPKQVKEALEAVGQRQYGSVIVKVGERSKVLSLLDDLAELDVPIGENPMPGGRSSLPTLQSYDGEEAISTAIKRLLVEGTPKVYFVSNYTRVTLTEGIAHSYSELVSALVDDGFEVAYLDLARTGHVPDDAAVVALMETQRELPEAESEALADWVRRGGRLLVNVVYLVDPPEWNPELDALGERLGFDLSRELVCHVVVDPRDPQNPVTGVPQVQNLTIVNLNPVHPVTRPLARSQRYPVLKAAREVRARDDAPPGVRVDTSFLRTGPYAWLEERTPRTGAWVVDWVGPAAKAAYAPRCVGAVIDVDPEEGGRSGHAVVLAAAGFDNLGFRHNRDLALNVFNWLAEREALVTIRGRSYVARELALTPQQFDRVFWLLVVGVPGLLLVLGLGVFWRRSRG